MVWVANLIMTAIDIGVMTEALSNTLIVTLLNSHYSNPSPKLYISNPNPKPNCNPLGATVVKYPRTGRPAKKLFRFSFVEGKIYLTWMGKFGNQGVDLGEVSEP
jgi:hypothetical protein